MRACDLWVQSSLEHFEDTFLPFALEALTVVHEDGFWLLSVAWKFYYASKIHISEKIPILIWLLGALVNILIGRAFSFSQQCFLTQKSMLMLQSGFFWNHLSVYSVSTFGDNHCVKIKTKTKENEKHKEKNSCVLIWKPFLELNGRWIVIKCIWRIISWILWFMSRSENLGELFRYQCFR